MSQLIPRKPAPALMVPTLDGYIWNLSQQKPENFTLIVFYRGYHCPFCRRNLRDIDQHIQQFQNLGVNVIAISTDPYTRASLAKEEWELENLTIGYGLSFDKAREWGLYISQAIKESEPDQFTEPGFFLIRPDGELFSSMVQTVPFGRPSAAQLLELVSKVLEKNYPPRGEVE